MCALVHQVPVTYLSRTCTIVRSTPVEMNRWTFFQVHAPLPGKITDRVLMLFVCVSPTCCTTESAFTALRCQLQPQSETVRLSNAQEANASHSFGAVKWGEPATAESRNSTEDQAAPDFSDLLSQLDDLAVLPSCPARAPADTIRDNAMASVARTRQDGSLRSFGPELPGFIVNFGAAGATLAPGLDDEHIQRLLDEYHVEKGSTISEALKRPGAELYEETDAMTQFVEDFSEAPSQCSRCVHLCETCQLV